MATKLWQASDGHKRVLFVLIKRDHSRLEVSVTDLILNGIKVSSVQTKIDEDIRVIGKKLLKESNLSNMLGEWKTISRILDEPQRQHIKNQINALKPIVKSLNEIRKTKQKIRYEAIMEHLLKK